MDLPLTAGDIFDGPYQPIGLDRVALQTEADRDVLVDAEFIHFVVDTDVHSDVVSVKRVINQVEFLHVGESYEISVPMHEICMLMSYIYMCKIYIFFQ